MLANNYFKTGKLGLKADEIPIIAKKGETILPTKNGVDKDMLEYLTSLAGVKRFHTGGVVGSDLGNPISTMPKSLLRPQLRNYDDRGTNGNGGVSVTMNITASDANSFKESEGQIMSQMRLAMERAAQRSRSR